MRGALGTLLGRASGPHDLRVTYTPDSGFSGPDSFSFRVWDDLAPSEARTVEVTVGAAP